MSLKERIKERDEQLDLLSCFIQKDTQLAPRSTLVYGNESTGKSYTVKGYLDNLEVKYSWIQCDECIAIRILLKRVILAIQVDSGLRSKGEAVVDVDATKSFDGFISQLQDFITTENYNEQHYIVLDRADRFIEEGEDIYSKFIKLHEVSRIANISIIFITSTQPRRLITSSIPTIFFENYDSEQIIRILGETPKCSFSSRLKISDADTSVFWKNYVGVIVESYFPYTTNITILRRIAIRLWSKFTEEIENGNFKISDFLSLYRQNVGLLSSNYAFETSLKNESTQKEEQGIQVLNSNFPLISKYIIIAGYLASFNDPKYDWVFFSKLKDFHKKKQYFRTSKASATRLNSRLLEPSPFDLERLLAISHAIYSLENAKRLPSNLDIATQIANLSSLKILLKSANNDYISAKTKWKINVNFQYVKKLADDLNFPIENYLAE